MASEHVRPSRAYNLVKVVFELPKDDWHGFGSESLWAEELSKGKYRLQNVPFAVYGYSYDDVVSAREQEEELVVEGPVLRGGHSTFRIFLAEGLTPDDKAFREAWAPLKLMGCGLERATLRLFAIDVPPSADLQEVVNLLQKGKQLGVWDCEKAHQGHI